MSRLIWFVLLATSRTWNVSRFEFSRVLIAESYLIKLLNPVKPPLPGWCQSLIAFIFQDRRQFLSHRYFHQGSFEMGESSDLLDLINYSDYRLGHSLDSSDGSQPYPSPGSLSQLDRLAALGTMGPAGSITSSVYINPFHPPPSRSSQDSLASPRRRVKMSARSTSNELPEWAGGSGDLRDLRDLRDHKQRKPRTSQVSHSPESALSSFLSIYLFFILQLRSLSAARSGSLSLVDCNSFTDSPARESSFIETRNRNNRRSPAMPGRIVGALNQGLASLGEKIGNNKHQPPAINLITSQHYISGLILTRD